MKTKTVSIGSLTLGDLQLIHQGLAVIGEQNRVDRRLLSNWRDLMSRTDSAVKRAINWKAIRKRTAQQADKETGDAK